MGKFIDPKASQRTVKVTRKRSGKAFRVAGIGKCLKNFIKRRKELHEGEKIAEPKIQDEDFLQDLRFEVVQDPKSGVEHLQLLKPICDLFAADELKASYEHYIRNNLIYTIFDEIALEGLDGITIEALWKRIRYTLKWAVLPWRYKQMIWKVACLSGNLRFYQLPVSRGVLNLNMDFSSLEADSPLVSPTHYTWGDIYKVVLPPRDSNQMGSCSTLDTRIDITEDVRKMSLMEAIRLYDNKLVMVAAECLRKNAIFDITFDPNVELVPLEYCLLERFGRARDIGEVTLCLSNSLTGFGFDGKSMFHHYKVLTRECLITRQVCLFSGFENGSVPRLITLRRFYHKRKSRFLIMMESLVNYLKGCPGCRAPWSELRNVVGRGYAKLIRSPEYSKYIDSQISIPYKEYYKGAKYEEYMTKSRAKEKTVKLSQLKDPHVNIVAVWKEKDASDDEDDEDAEGQDDLNKGRRMMNKEFITVVYQFIVSKGPEGATTLQVVNEFDCSATHMRQVFKRLLSRKLVDCRKFDVGKTTSNKYIAKCFLDDTKRQLTPSPPVAIRPSTSLQKLKEKQKRRCRAAEQNPPLTRTQHSLAAPTFTIPSITLDHFTSTPTLNSTYMKLGSQLVPLAKLTLKPFRLNLKTFQIRGLFPFELTHPDGATHPATLQPSALLAEPNSSTFKPDNFTKAFLFRALLNNSEFNEEVVDFLDPNSSNRKAVKRPAPEEPKEVSEVSQDHKRPATSSVTVLGAASRLIFREEIESMEFTMELHESIAFTEYKTGDITQYRGDNTLTERVLSRILFILQTIQKWEVFEDVIKLVKIIVEHETKTGYDKKIDRRSLHRILKKLAEEGYLRLFNIIANRADYRRSQFYICHPAVTSEHYKLKESVAQLKEKTLAYVRKPLDKRKIKEEKSPFVQEDVLKSLYEIKMLTDGTSDTVRLPRKVLGKHYGFRPKFARMALIHEFLFYLVYELDKNTRPLPKEAVDRLFKEHKMALTPDELESLPPVYAYELSWKSFVSPLPQHRNWEQGWALMADVILRFPINLIFRSHAVNFTYKEMQQVVNHPYQRFYMPKYVSPTLRMVIMHQRKFVYGIMQHLQLLSFCGLVQFGPYAFHDKEKSFFYLNRRATLWDTTSSQPQFLVIEDKEYPVLSFHFHSGRDVVKYWSTMYSICTGTQLNKRSAPSCVVETNPFAKLSLQSAKDVRIPESVKNFDTGELPGDHKGAAGLDSSLFAHKMSNWNFFAHKSESGQLESLLSLKHKPADVDGVPVPSKPPSHKFYIAKPKGNSKPTPESHAKKKTFKIKLVSKNAKSTKRRVKKTRIMVDAIDQATIRKAGGLRRRVLWSNAEDRLLILLKIASVFVTPWVSIQKVNYRVLRDILHIANPKSRDKTARTVCNRIKLLVRTMPYLANIETLISNLYKLPIMVRYFIPLRRFIQEQSTEGSYKKLTLPDHQMTTAFMFVAYYFVKFQNEVEVAIHGRYTTLDYFNNSNKEIYEGRIEPWHKKRRVYSEATCVDEVVENTLKSTIICALGHRSNQSKMPLQTYKIYQQFREDLLRSTLNEMRSHRMLQKIKNSMKVFFGRYRLSAYYSYSNSASFWYNTMETAYKTFLDLKHRQSEADWNLAAWKNYGRLFGSNEVLSFMLPQATLQFHFPKYHLILNPETAEEHDEVVEELAKRYQAKIRSETKTAESPKKDSDRKMDVDDDDPETALSKDDEEFPPAAAATARSQEVDVVISDDEEPLDLSITAKDSSTIDNLKHWISDCIDAERVRSPSPELLNLEIKQEVLEDDGMSTAAQSTVAEATLLTLEEIKKGMLKPDDETGKRDVPYISDLTKLLGVVFDESDCDERANYLMKKHFVQEFPTLEAVTVDGLKTNYLSDVLEHRETIKKIWAKVEREAFVEAPDNIKALAELQTVENPNLAHEVLSYIEDKDVLGAPGYDIKERFSSHPVASLEQILAILVDHHLVLKTGVTRVVFVHHKFRNPWLTGTFRATQQQAGCFAETATKVNPDLNVLVNESAQWYKIKPLPWIDLEGTLDKNLFKMWLSQVFSYCIDNPKIPFEALSDKFGFLKPADLFYLLEVLEESGALEIRRFVSVPVDLFSCYQELEECRGTALDRFEELYVEPNNVGFTALGSLFAKIC